MGDEANSTVKYRDIAGRVHTVTVLERYPDGGLMVIGPDRYPRPVSPDRIVTE